MYDVKSFITFLSSNVHIPGDPKVLLFDKSLNNNLLFCYINILSGMVSGDIKQSKQHKTISFMSALRGLVFSPMQLQKDSPPSSSFLSSLRGKSSSGMLKEWHIFTLTQQAVNDCFSSEILSVLSYFHLKL